MPHRELSLRDVYLARQRIMSLAQRTPIIDAPKLSERGNRRIVFKPENLQTTGSFKVRGATNKLLSLSEEERGSWCSDCFEWQSRQGDLLCRQ